MELKTWRGDGKVKGAKQWEGDGQVPGRDRRVETVFRI